MNPSRSPIISALEFLTRNPKVGTKLPLATTPDKHTWIPAVTRASKRQPEEQGAPTGCHETPLRSSLLIPAGRWHLEPRVHGPACRWNLEPRSYKVGTLPGPLPLSQIFEPRIRDTRGGTNLCTRSLPKTRRQRIHLMHITRRGGEKACRPSISADRSPIFL